MAPSIDWISSLPDAVLCHILSFLPTKQAVSTSILSKRWTDLWRSVPTLYFRNILVNDREAYFRFNEFVYSVLLARNSIKSCILDIWYNDPHLGHLGFPNFIKWINAVVQRGVERLEFCAGVYDNLKLPISILSCRTLVVFKVSGFTVKGFSSITLPSLKILRLVECTFINARDFVLLLAGCPILENLDASVLEFISKDSLSYQECESLDLKKLTIAHMPYTFCHFPLKALHNVEELYIEINKVYQRFDEIPTFQNLTKLKLYSINSNWNLLVRVLNHCPNLQNVELNKGTSVDVGLNDDVQENWVDPIFVPRCLSLHLKVCKLKLFSGQQDEFLLATYILKNARVLQTMIIGCLNGLEKEKERELSLCPRASPTCELIINVNNLYL